MINISTMMMAKTRWLFSGAAKRAEDLGVVYDFRPRVGTAWRDKLRASPSATAVVPSVAARMAAQGTRLLDESDLNAASAKQKCYNACKVHFPRLVSNKRASERTNPAGHVSLTPHFLPDNLHGNYVITSKFIIEDQARSYETARRLLNSYVFT